MITNVILTILIVFKLMFFMRIYDKLGMLVELVKRVSIDVLPFTIFLLIWLIAFSILYCTLGSYDSDDEDDKISLFLIYFL